MFPKDIISTLHEKLRKRTDQEKARKKAAEKEEDEVLIQEVKKAFQAQSDFLKNGTNEQLIMMALAKILDPGLGSFSEGVTKMPSSKLALELKERASK